ncbi:uncharacterized protein BO97DRAFT_445924 [Aspergillus homomorphus CBS 101889]|uniref:MFS general substrate transporter n=1 Tax=Aspergillus homomorphus (strain CBS 101889) TaxID=1450537 RepID=A0A395HPD6_ASPHC|nr:hypothetical protein BO97DRAFT_445924 [Aspergillus homomorphus CBS 101889]RAL08718.1 hypothetical protein BO97DRAFT_445924 [Aspergillus homomorphus CBS 101889]
MLTRNINPESPPRPEPEEYLLLIPTGLLLFDRTGCPTIHWITSLLGAGLYSADVWIILECMCLYLPATYPRYAASLFAANDFCSSALAAGAVHYGVLLYRNLGVDRGSTVLAGLGVLGVLGMALIWLYGGMWRRHSRFGDSGLI